jgi:hypothetical protein
MAGESFNLSRGDWVLNPMAEKVGKVESGSESMKNGFIECR